MPTLAPYCGVAPIPGALLERFNLDPALLAALLLLFVLHRNFLLRSRAGDGHSQRLAAAGWIVVALALTSPLCALSVSLFSARIAQHTLLMLVAAPLLALALPISARATRRPWASAFAFMTALWFWHMPVPYDATFASTPVYWTMHVTLLGSSLGLWRELLHHGQERAIGAFAASVFTCAQMGLLGALLTFAAYPQFAVHLTTTAAWGLTPLQDQQLGGTLMWVPGTLVFLAAAMRSLLRSGLAGRLGASA